MKIENKYNRTIRKEDLDTRMEYTIKTLKYVTTKYVNKLVITIDFKGEMVIYLSLSILIPKQSILKRNLKKLDKGMILKVIPRK